MSTLFGSPQERKCCSTAVTGSALLHACNTPDHIAHIVRYQQVKAVDTTGAGDCFVGVLAAAMDRGLEMQPAMRRACVAASMACTLVGAAPSFPTEVAIDRMLERSAMSEI